MTAPRAAALLFVVALGAVDVVKAQCTCDFCPYGFNPVARCGADTAGCTHSCPNCGTCETWSCESVPTVRPHEAVRDFLCCWFHRQWRPTVRRFKRKRMRARAAPGIVLARRIRGPAGRRLNGRLRLVPGRQVPRQLLQLDDVQLLPEWQEFFTRVGLAE